MLPPVFLSLRLCSAGLRIQWFDPIAEAPELRNHFQVRLCDSLVTLGPVRRNVNQISWLCLPKISSGRQKVLKEVAEREGFELPIQSCVVALNAPKKATNL